jgi:DNA-binding transcriptional MerR regulator
VAKGPEAFRTISEASKELGVAQHVLRFWETKFNFVRPMKRAGGRRFYRPNDIAILATVHRLLHQEGYTIKGVQKLHRERGLKRLAPDEGAVAAAPIGDLGSSDRQASGSPGSAAYGRLEGSLAALEAAKTRLDALLQAR